MKVDLYDANGNKKGQIELDKNLFLAPINTDLIHRAVIMRQSNARNPIAHTLTRGEVNYSTRKLFRQKGTGNARRGARSTNLLRGGGVTHGPRRVSTFIKNMPKKEKRLALFSALSYQAQEKNVFGLETGEIKVPKTKDFVNLLSKLPQGKNYLFVLPEKNEGFEKSCRNVPKVKTILASYLNPYDVLMAQKVCFLPSALEATQKNFLKTPSS